MNFLVFTIFLLLITQNSFSIYGENTNFDLKNSTEPIEVKSSSSKIHPILIKWQTSEDPEKFAKENNLSYNENNIRVYIHLKNEESQSAIASEVDVISFYKEIAVAYVSIEQLDKLDNLDFVEKVTPPNLVRIPPIPTTEISQTQTLEENQNDYLVWVVLGGITIFAIFALKYKNSKARKKLNSN